MPPVPSRQQVAQAQALQAKTLGSGNATAAMGAPAARMSSPAAPRVSQLMTACSRAGAARALHVDMDGLHANSLRSSQVLWG